MTSEYGVLDGALALAIPTIYGQKMTTKQTRKSDLHWFAYDMDGNEWFKAQISLMDFSPVKTTDDEKALYLQKLLKGAVRLNSEFLSKWNGFDVKTYLEFPKDWGLGSSSTLIYLVAQWADVNPLLLHFQVSEGSGYDAASAGADLPITYQMIDDTINYTEIEFRPVFGEHLYFVSLNQKQSSPDAVKHYLKNTKGRKSLAKEQTEITQAILKCNSLNKFIDLIDRHEQLVSDHVGLERVKDKYFSDFDGGIKSLGAWGGDFVLVACKGGLTSMKTYFSNKGYDTVIPYREMIYREKVVIPA